MEGGRAAPTASVCEAVSGGNIRAVSQHLVSPPGKHPREASQPEHLCVFPEHPLPCASPYWARTRASVGPAGGGAGRSVQENLQYLTLTQQLSTPDGLFLRILQGKNGVLRHTDSVFQRSLSPPGFVRQDGEVISFKDLLLARSAMRRASISINGEHLGDLTLALLSVAGQVSAGRDSALSAHPADAGGAGAPLPAGRPEELPASAPSPSLPIARATEVHYLRAWLGQGNLAAAISWSWRFLIAGMFSSGFGTLFHANPLTQINRNKHRSTDFDRDPQTDFHLINTEIYLATPQCAVLSLISNLCGTQTRTR